MIDGLEKGSMSHCREQQFEEKEEEEEESHCIHGGESMHWGESYIALGWGAREPIW